MSSKPFMHNDGNGYLDSGPTRPKRVKVYPEPTKRVRVKAPKCRTSCITFK